MSRQQQQQQQQRAHDNSGERHHSSSSISSLSASLIWHPSQDLIDTTTTDPSSICKVCRHGKYPRLAKDEDYAKAVLEAWNNDILQQKDQTSSKQKNVGANVVYNYERKENSDEIINDNDLYGHLVVPSYFTQNDGNEMTTPAIILFHTGAGPQDVFLRWKADVLARELNCVVFIADIIGDADGYAWSDRDRYDNARKTVLATSKKEEGVARWKLRRDITAAIDYLKNLQFVNVDNIAALGWCMGGHPILELGLMQEKSVKALISYHGVFDGVKHYMNDLSEMSPTIISNPKTQVLICNGKDDPFVQEDDIKNAKNLLQIKGCDVTILDFNGVRHGFTNPAQDFNPSDAFAFNKPSANKSWDETIQLLKKTLLT